jgi:hypothetical protein
MDGKISPARTSRNMTRIDGDPFPLENPVTIIGIPFSYSIADGLSLGFSSRESIQRSCLRDQLAHLSARDCARGVFRLCAKPNGLAQIQASSGSGPSDSGGAVAVLTAARRNAGIRQPSTSQK